MKSFPNRELNPGPLADRSDALQHYQLSYRSKQEVEMPIGATFSYIYSEL